MSKQQTVYTIWSLSQSEQVVMAASFGVQREVTHNRDWRVCNCGASLSSQCLTPMTPLSLLQVLEPMLSTAFRKERWMWSGGSKDGLEPVRNNQNPQGQTGAHADLPLPPAELV